MTAVGVFLMGVGGIGSLVAKLLLQDSRFALRGAADTDAAKSGRDLGDLLQMGKLGIEVASRPLEALEASDAQVVIHATTSFLPRAFPEVMACVQRGKHVVSTCEELAYPWARYPELASQLDQEAKAHGVRVLGGGVNPGMVMDLLPIILAANVGKITHVKVRRVVDLAGRRPQLQRKAGLGLTPEEFQVRLQERAIGHVGLLESAHLIASALGWHLQEVREQMTPLLAPRPMRHGAYRLSPGQVAGFRQELVGIAGDEPVLRMELVMALEPPDAMDAIEIEGSARVRAIFLGGIPGDVATASLMLQWAWVVACYPGPMGLMTVRDLPLWPRQMGG